MEVELSGKLASGGVLGKGFEVKRRMHGEAVDDDKDGWKLGMSRDRPD